MAMITLRPMEATKADYTLMRDWFAEPELQKWVWCDEKGEPPVTLERIEEKYGGRVKHPKDVFPYFILRDGTPIGFIQYYLQDENTAGLDMWIGVASERSRGFGSEALRQMAATIRRKHPGVRELFIDPETENRRAVRCYEKAGFRTTEEILDEEGSRCLLMKMRFNEEEE